MYKVFFNDKALFLTDDFTENFKESRGLFYKYKTIEDLKEIVSMYAEAVHLKPLYVYHFDIEQLRDDFRMCFKNIDAAGGLVSNQNGEYLLIYRRGKWDLPKGKVDKGENYPQAATREVAEETGLKSIKIEKPLMSTYHTYPFNNRIALKKTYWFSMKLIGDDIPVPEIEEDIEEVRWFKPDDLTEAFENTYPLIRDIFNYAGLLSQ